MRLTSPNLSHRGQMNKDCAKLVSMTITKEELLAEQERTVDTRQDKDGEEKLFAGTTIMVPRSNAKRTLEYEDENNKKPRGEGT